MFRGLFAANLDVKGRLLLPVRWRERLQAQAGGQVVITIDTDAPCLLLYPLEAWSELEQKISALPSFDPMTRRLQRLLIGHATDHDLDKQGRLLIAPLLREYAQFVKQVMLVGQGPRLELWSESNWATHREQWLSVARAEQGPLPEALQSLSL